MLTKHLIIKKNTLFAIWIIKNEKELSPKEIKKKCPNL